MLIGRFGVKGRSLCVGGAVTVSARFWIMQAVVCMVVQQQCFGCIDGRVQLRAGIQVLSVQVHTPRISPAKKRQVNITWKKPLHTTVTCESAERVNFHVTFDLPLLTSTRTAVHIHAL